MSNKIDHIFYINLEERVDRKELIEIELNNFDLKYERFSAIKDEMGIYGCGLSHLSVLKLAKEREYKNVLIFEDDFTFLVSKEEFETFLDQFFNHIEKFDVCMLAYNTQKEEATNHSFVKKIIESQSASAYLVNHHYYDKLIHLYEENIPKLKETGMHWMYANDQIWKQYQPGDDWYQPIIRIGKQRADFSNIAGRFMDYNC